MRIKHIFIFGILFLVWQSVAAQLIDNSTGISLLERHQFNPAFVRANNLAVISGELSAKKESDIIRPSSESVEYHFDRRGRLVQFDVINRLSKKRNDRTSTIYRYDTDGTLIDKIIADLNGATSYSYKYDDEQRVRSETCSRMESPKDTLSPTGPKRTEIYTETFKYTQLKHGEKKITFNSYDRPYKEEFFYRDENGYLLEYSRRLIMNNQRSITKYTYNNRGLLSEKTVQGDVSKDEIIRFEYDYDDAGNLLAAREIHNDALVRRMEFLYDQKTWILNARVTKDEETELIRIARYECSYFDGLSPGN